MSSTQFKEVNSSSVSWTQYIRRDWYRVLVQDEIEEKVLPDIAAGAWTFDVCNRSGDWPQGRKTDENNLWMSAGWFQHKGMSASVTTAVLSEEHRYGEQVASLCLPTR
jgi:hypothetical protein